MNQPSQKNLIQAPSVAATSGASQPMRVLVVSTTFPSVADPYRGVFVKERIKALAHMPDFEVRVISPVPWFPPIKAVKKWYKWSQYPREEIFDGLTTYHPRYLLPPKVGGYFHSELILPVVRRLAKRIYKQFPFDLIDSHFVYPNGVVATKLAQSFQVPVTMTGRGEDMIRFPNDPMVGDRIRWALPIASQCVGVSREIADAMEANGAAPERTQVIANGIDRDKFHPLEMAKCRDRLNLPQDRKIILSVGELIPRKGFDYLVNAMPQVIKKHPSALLVIVGRKGRFGRDCTASIQATIREHSLEDHILFAGACPHDELVYWYNSADLFALMSASEGSPNVLLEAFACGTPAIATPVGGIPDEFALPGQGILLTERTTEAAVASLMKALSTKWDRQLIAERMQSRTWTAVAQKFATVLKSARAAYTVSK